MPEGAGMLVKVSGDGRSFVEALTGSLGVAAARLEPILTVPAATAAEGPTAVASSASTWLRLDAPLADHENPWDRAHALLDTDQPFAFGASAGIEAVEPDLVQDWSTEARGQDNGLPAAMANEASFCSFDDQKKSGGREPGPGPGWNLDQRFSQLRDARERVGANMRRILIAHLDTGYDPDHITLPAHLRLDLQKNFVSDGRPDNDAVDHAPADALFANRGHGTGTLSLLAGNRLNGSSPGWDAYADFIGGAPLADILPDPDCGLGCQIFHRHPGARAGLRASEWRSCAIDEHGVGSRRRRSPTPSTLPTTTDW